MKATQNILIIDDDHNLRNTLVDILELRGFKSTAVGSGKQALECANNEVFQIALIDLRLEDMPGLEVLKAIKEISPDTECIIMTGYASAETAIQAVNLGAYSYVQKPYDIDQLILTIDRAREKSLSRQALNESEERYRQLYEGAIDGILVTDLKGRILEYNAAFLKILHYTPQELQEKSFWDLTPENYHTFEKGIVKQILKTGYSDIYEKEFFDKDGFLVPVEISGYLTKDQEGNPVGMWGFVRDISERKYSEKKLQRQLMEVTVLRDIAASGSESRSIDELVERVTSILGKTIYSDYFGVNLYDSEKNWLKPHFSFHGIDYSARKEGIPAGIGITGRTVRLGKSQLVNDVSKDKDYVPWVSTTLSEISVPIKTSNGLFGVINAESKEISHFTKDDLNLLTAIANQMAIAIDNIYLQQNQQRHLKELAALYETSLAISSVMDTHSLYEKVYQQVSQLFPLDAFLLATYNSLDETTSIVYAIEEEKPLGELLDQRYSREESGLMGWMMQNQKPLRFGNMLKENLPVESPQEGKPILSWLGIPLMVKGKVVGAISVQCFDENVYSEDHLRLLESLGAQLAVAMDNARLLGESQNQVDRLAALHDLDMVINSSLDLRVTMNIVLDQIVEKLNVDAAAVLLLNSQNQMLEYAAGRGFRTTAIEKYSVKLGEGVSGQAAMERHLIQALNLDESDEDHAYTSILQIEHFESYYSVPLLAKGHVKGVLDVFHRKLLNPGQDWFNFLETMAGQAAIAIDNTSLLENLNRTNVDLTLAYDTTLEGWSKALDMRDKETEGHTQRVAELTLKIARHIGIADEDLVHIRRGALLHDIGKMGIPDNILLKPGPLDENEWDVMRSHASLAHDLLYPIAYLRPALDIPAFHHEKFDGSGYPYGLAGEQIPLPARIFAIVDVWDALTSDRPYRKAWTAKKALEYIREQSGKHFDPQIVEVFLRLIQSELINGKADH